MFFCCSAYSPGGLISKGHRARAGRSVFIVLHCFVWMLCLSGAAVLPFCQVAGCCCQSSGRCSWFFIGALDRLIISSPAGADGLHCQTKKKQSTKLKTWAVDRTADNAGVVRESRPRSPQSHGRSIATE